MPWEIKIVSRKDRNGHTVRNYRVINKLTGRIHSYSTTKEKAIAQLKILERLEEKDKNKH